MIYEAQFRINVGKAIPAVGELLDSINTHLATDGYDERIECHAPIFSIDVSVNRELTKEEQHKVKTVLEANVITGMPQYDISLVSFCRKPSNVLQSAVL